MDPLFIVVAALMILVVFMAWKLHKAGVPNAALPGQIALQAGDFADATRDKLVALIAKEVAEHGAALPDLVKAEVAKLTATATLKDSYCDGANFMQDVGRLPATFAQAITLDGRVEKDGTLPALDYKTDEQTPKNVRRVKAPAA